MNILITSRLFLPVLGGSVDSCCYLAKGLRDLGHEVKISTRTPAEKPDDPVAAEWPDLVRNPSWREQLRLARWCDVALQIELSLKDVIPLLWMGKPVVPTIHTNINEGPGHRTSLQITLKRELLRFFPTIAVSAFVAKNWRLRAVPIVTTYDDEVFRFPDGAPPRENGIIYLGRHVSEKGLQVLIEALVMLKKKGIRPKTSILGDGPMRSELEAAVTQAGMDGWVEFSGRLTTSDMVDLMQRSRVQVVPSIWEEPLGLVVMQGLACGCRVVASHCGGIPEAGGNCALYCQPGDARDLADQIERALAMPETLTDEERARVGQHLFKMTRRQFALEYEKVLQDVIAGRFTAPELDATVS
jgi:glycosyltransferase involved in cell wall biosynthesis